MMAAKAFRATMMMLTASAAPSTPCVSFQIPASPSARSCMDTPMAPSVLTCQGVSHSHHDALSQLYIDRQNNKPSSTEPEQSNCLPLILTGCSAKCPHLLGAPLALALHYTSAASTNGLQPSILQPSALHMKLVLASHEWCPQGRRRV